MTEKKSTQVAVPPDVEARLAKLGMGADDPMGGFDDPMLRTAPPAYKIEYGRTTAEGVDLKVGWFTRPDLTQVESLRVVILAQSAGRILWPETFSNASLPMCKSVDRIKPTGSGDEPRQGPCNACPDARWGDDDKPPRCAQTIDFLMYDLDRKCPFLFQAKRGGCRQYEKQFLLALKYAAPKIRYEGLPPNCCVEVLVTREERTTPTTHYLPVFTLGEQVSYEQALECTEELLALRDALGTRIDPEASTQHPAGGGGAPIAPDPEEDEIPFARPLSPFRSDLT